MRGGKCQTYFNTYTCAYVIFNHLLCFMFYVYVLCNFFIILLCFVLSFSSYVCLKLLFYHCVNYLLCLCVCVFVIFKLCLGIFPLSFMCYVQFYVSFDLSLSVMCYYYVTCAQNPQLQWGAGPTPGDAERTRQCMRRAAL